MTPRFKVLKNGTGIICGVPADELRSILTAAALYRYDHKFKPEPLPEVEVYTGQRAIIARNNTHNAKWYELQMWIIKELEDSLDAPRRERYCKDERSLKERLQENQRVRKMIDEILQERMKERT